MNDIYHKAIAAIRAQDILFKRGDLAEWKDKVWLVWGADPTQLAYTLIRRSDNGLDYVSGVNAGELKRYRI